VQGSGGPLREADRALGVTGLLIRDELGPDLNPETVSSECLKFSPVLPGRRSGCYFQIYRTTATPILPHLSLSSSSPSSIQIFCVETSSSKNLRSTYRNLYFTESFIDTRCNTLNGDWNIVRLPATQENSKSMYDTTEF
jgi:hypothetical protein